DRAIVIIPTYNEAINVPVVLEQLLHLPEPVSVLIVDDGSPDGTAARVREAQARYPGRIHLIERAGKLGLGTAYIAGFRYALAHRFTYVCEMDADLSHNPADVPRLVAAVRSGAADLAVGSRYVGGVRVMNWPLTRLMIS